MVTALPWRSTQPFPAHTRTERPRRTPNPRAPTTSVPATQSHAVEDT